MTEAYVKIKAILHMITRDAAQISPSDKGAFPDAVWIPRSLIHGGDDLKLAKAMRNDEVTFRLLDWKAKELGLTGRPAAEQSEMDLS